MVNYQPTIDRNLSMVKSQTRIERDRAGPTSKLWRPMGDDSVFQLAGFVFLATLLGFGQTMPDPWLILSGGKTGSINAHTTRNDLVRLYGTANVVDQDVDVGEGEMQSATFLFPKDPERRIEILWKDPGTKTAPESADVRGKKSRWHALHGISLGTTSTELEHINGQPFLWTVMNDGTDMRQGLISWRGGALEKEFQEDGRVILELEGAPTKGALPRSPHESETNSDDPVWRRQNPRVSRMRWLFPSKLIHSHERREC